MEKFLHETIKAAGAIALEYYVRGVTAEVKSHRVDLLTEADTAVSEFLVQKIHTQFPDHHIHSEEMGTDINPGAEFEWVIDPIDGTWNFKNRVPLWAVMITILHHGVPEYTAVYFPVINEFYYARRGHGAWLNGARIMMSAFAEIGGSAGDGHVQPFAPLVEKYRRAWHNLSMQQAHVTNYGSMFGAAWTVRGFFDFYINNDGRDHDYLPFVLLAEEGGALVTDSDGHPWQRDRRDIVMANPVLHPKIIELFR